MNTQYFGFARLTSWRNFLLVLREVTYKTRVIKHVTAKTIKNKQVFFYPVWHDVQKELRHILLTDEVMKMVEKLLTMATFWQHAWSSLLPVKYASRRRRSNSNVISYWWSSSSFCLQLKWESALFNVAHLLGEPLLKTNSLCLVGLSNKEDLKWASQDINGFLTRARVKSFIF